MFAILKFLQDEPLTEVCLGNPSQSDAEQASTSHALLVVRDILDLLDHSSNEQWHVGVAHREMGWEVGIVKELEWVGEEGVRGVDDDSPGKTK